MLFGGPNQKTGPKCLLPILYSLLPIAYCRLRSFQVSMFRWWQVQQCAGSSLHWTRETLRTNGLWKGVINHVECCSRCVGPCKHQKYLLTIPMYDYLHSSEIGNILQAKLGLFFVFEATALPRRGFGSESLHLESIWIFTLFLQNPLPEGSTFSKFHVESWNWNPDFHFKTTPWREWLWNGNPNPN